ncbi:MAG TPA: hypothetical protein VFS35_07885, partial [Terrimicrobiaceae bacterium]|nr:hypothetical protein [Terrimicrobiaceae bacterium]
APSRLVAADLGRDLAGTAQAAGGSSAQLVFGHFVVLLVPVFVVELFVFLPLIVIALFLILRIFFVAFFEFRVQPQLVFGQFRVEQFGCPH